MCQSFLSLQPYKMLMFLEGEIQKDRSGHYDGNLLCKVSVWDGFQLGVKCTLTLCKGNFLNHEVYRLTLLFPAACVELGTNESSVQPFHIHWPFVMPQLCLLLVTRDH